MKDARHILQKVVRNPKEIDLHTMISMDVMLLLNFLYRLSSGAESVRNSVVYERSEERVAKSIGIWPIVVQSTFLRDAKAPFRFSGNFRYSQVY